MSLQIPSTGLQLEEDFTGSLGHLPTQAFILDLSDDVIEGLIAAADRGEELSISLGKKPTLNYGNSNYHIQPNADDERNDIELFFTNPAENPELAQCLPQPAMSLFRRPEIRSPLPRYHNNSSEEEDEDEEYDEAVSSPESEDVDQSYATLDSDIAQLRNSLAQKEAEKLEKSAKVIEGIAPLPNGKNAAKRTAGSLQKALSGRRSPFGRASLSPLPTSPALSAIGSPSLAPSDATAQQAAEKAKRVRAPIIHELAFKDQSYDELRRKYPGSETDFKNALDKVADIDQSTRTYVLRNKYWKDLDVWAHDYASDDDRQEAIARAIRKFDKMRLSLSDPEWDMLLRKEERGRGRVVSQLQVNIARGPAAPKIRVQKPEDSSADSGNGGGNDSGSGSNRTDEDGVESDRNRSPSRPTNTKKTMSAREAQEKRILSTKKKPTAAPSSIKASPAKAGAKMSNDKRGKFKSEEFVHDSDTTDSESESVPLSASVQSKLAASNAKATSFGSPKVYAARAGSPAVSATKERKEDRSTPTPVAARKAKPSPLKEVTKPAVAPKPQPTKKRARDSSDDDSSSSGGSSSGTPLMKRIKPLKTAPKTSSVKDVREKTTQPSKPTPPARASNVSPNGSSDSTSSSTNGGGNGLGISHGATKTTSANKTKSNTSPVKSSPLASSPPTNASELDLSSEESVPPIGNSSTSRKRKMVDERRNNMSGDASSNGNKTKKRRTLPEDLVVKALQFKEFYEKYAALYKDISSRTNPPKDRVAELLKMHNRLQEMKSSIHSEAMLRA